MQALGVSAETCQAFGAGYAPKGILRGRLAIPVRDRDGTLLAYCGRAVRDESPRLTFPNGFDPAAVIFNVDRIAAGELYLVRDPLAVLVAQENGIDNVVAFLTDGIAAQQLEMLAALMDEKKLRNRRAILTVHRHPALRPMSPAPPTPRRGFHLPPRKRLDTPEPCRQAPP